MAHLSLVSSLRNLNSRLKFSFFRRISPLSHQRFSTVVANDEEVSPISELEFDSLMQASGFPERADSSAIGVAVSGGPDSLALALLINNWAVKRNRHVYALTVNHRVRPESTEEIEFFHPILRERGIYHEKLELSWEEVETATITQDAMRKTRFAVLPCY